MKPSIWAEFVANSSGLFLVLLSYFCVLSWVFIKVLIVDWSYMGYQLSIDNANVVISIALIWLSALLVSSLKRPDGGEKASGYLLLFFIMSVCVPTSILCSLGGGKTEQILLAYLVLYFLTGIVGFFPYIRVPFIVDGKHYFFFLAGAVILGAVLISVKGGFSRLNFNPGEIYEFRAEQKQIIQGSSAYIVNWAVKIALPFFLVYSIRVGSTVFGGGVLLLTFLMFGFLNSKTTLIFPFLIIGIYLFMGFSKNYLRFSLLIVLGLSVLILIAEALEMSIISGLLIRRGIFSGSVNTMYYMEYFGENDFIFWSNSFLTGLSEYPYSHPPGQIIGFWLGEPNNHNAGFLASGFMHAGYFGVILYSLIMGLILVLFDSLLRLCSQRDLRLVCSLFIPLFLHVCVNVDLVNAMFTHGVLYFLLLLYLYVSGLERKLGEAYETTVYQ